MGSTSNSNLAGRKAAWVALFGGATGIGLAPVLVRLSEVGPVATGFYRLLLALPMLWLLNIRHAGRPRSNPRGPMHFALAGILFAGDLAVWHWSIRLTSVANSTFLTNFAPLFVAIGAYFLFGEVIRARLITGMLVAFAGGAVLMGLSFEVDSNHVLGDALGVVTAMFYAGYLLSVKSLRERHGVWEILLRAGIVCCGLLFLVAWMSGEQLWPASARGWLALIALAGVSHVVGQGLIAYALAHLPASVTAVILLFQPVVAAALAWVILGEPMSGLQLLGCLIVLSGIYIATKGNE